jgi:hypothetical protein
MAVAEKSFLKKSTKISAATDPEKIGQLIRSLLGISSPQNQTGNGRTSYNFWGHRLEATGILIFQLEKIPPEQVWGFPYQNGHLRL